MSLVYSQTHPVGWKALNFILKGTDDLFYSLDSFLDKKGLLIIFTCNHCPYSKASWPILKNMSQQYDHDIAFVAINPNDTITYPEDSFDEMKKFAQEHEITFPYLIDDTQEIAKAYNAQCTPDPYLFKMKYDSFSLFYQGRINDNWQNPEDAKEFNLDDAIKRILNNQEPPKKQPPSMGCSIKWKEL